MKERPDWVMILSEGCLVAFAVTFTVLAYPIASPLIFGHDWWTPAFWPFYLVADVLYVLGWLFLVCAACEFLHLVLSFLAHLIQAVRR